MEQTLSDRAQLTTIAFDALGFLTGTLGSDSFFPPGKVADFWGFQYLRDNDPSEMGHNTDFLTKAALNMLVVLDDDQRQQLVDLAREQVDDINQYGMARFTLMEAFRRVLERDLPVGTTGLDETAVADYSATLYQLDGMISLQRAEVMGPILAALTDEQRAALDALEGTGMTTWPDQAEPEFMRALSHDEKVAVMTYAGDLFSWYASDVAADVYFCPERQGTYFGSFYLKDAPAVGNPGYSIGTNITGDMGDALLAVLTPAQAELITSLVDDQRDDLNGIVTVRTEVAEALREFRTGGSTTQSTVDELMAEYGRLDGSLVYRYAVAFAEVAATLTADQQAALYALRVQTIGDLAPTGAYLYAQEIPMPAESDTDFLFA